MQTLEKLVKDHENRSAMIEMGLFLTKQQTGRMGEGLALIDKGIKGLGDIKKMFIKHKAEVGSLFVTHRTETGTLDGKDPVMFWMGVQILNDLINNYGNYI